MNGTRKLPQAFTMAHTAIVASPGRAIGITTSRRICNGLAPNTFADSSYERGVASMKSLRMKMAAGSSPPVITSTTPSWVSISLSSVISRKIGTIAAVPVTIEESSNSAYSNASRPGMRTRDSA